MGRSITAANARASIDAAPPRSSPRAETLFVRNRSLALDGHVIRLNGVDTFDATHCAAFVRQLLPKTYYGNTEGAPSLDFASARLLPSQIERKRIPRSCAVKPRSLRPA